MARKRTKTISFSKNRNPLGDGVDVSEPGFVYIDDEHYMVDGNVAQFILELLDEVERKKSKIEFLESVIGDYGDC